MAPPEKNMLLQSLDISRAKLTERMTNDSHFVSIIRCHGRLNIVKDGVCSPTPLEVSVKLRKYWPKHYAACSFAKPE